MTLELRSFLEDTEDINVLSVEKSGDSWFAELEWYTPLGEDFIFCIWYDGSDENFYDEFYRYYDVFDPDEHCAMWVPLRGTNGVPDSIRDLVNDAEDIDEFLKNVTDDLADFIADMEVA